MRNPTQPVVLASDNVARFKENAVVRFLLDNGKITMNQIALEGAKGNFSQDDMQQFAQLIGYSVDGYADLGYADPYIVRKADKKAAGLVLNE